MGMAAAKCTQCGADIGVEDSKGAGMQILRHRVVYL